MTTEQGWLVGAVATAAAVALVALVVAVRARSRASAAEARSDALAERVARLESPLTSALTSAPAVGAAAPREADVATFVITGVPAEPPPPVVAARDIDGRLFTDIVARETVVRAAAWTHGLRRALSSESRDRIRFAVRQETRRAGRDRRAEAKQALREFRARERAALRRDHVADRAGDHAAARVGEDVA